MLRVCIVPAHAAPLFQPPACLPDLSCLKSDFRLLSKLLSVPVTRKKATAMKQVSPNRSHNLKSKGRVSTSSPKIMLRNCENSGIISLKNKKKEMNILLQYN